MKKLKFGNSNRKMNQLAVDKGLAKAWVYSFDLPAGYTCPKANICLSRADRKTGKITDGKNCQFRCYAASGEWLSVVRNARWYNYELLKASDNMVDLILSSLPRNARIIRIHSSGDFFSDAYFNAWLEVAKVRSDIQFFAYTKVLKYVQAEKPSNLSIVYSIGGKDDALRTTEPACYVVKNEAEAEALNIKVACPSPEVADDYDFILRGESFAILLHGTQPAGSKA